MTMTDTTAIVPITVTVLGEVTQSNLSEVREAITERIANLNMEPETDDEFVQAKDDVKAIKLVEDQFTDAKSQILQQAEGIYAILNGIDECTDEMREARLKLDKAVKTKTAEVKSQILWDAIIDLECADRLKGQFKISVEGAIKGKKTLESMRKSVQTQVAIHNAMITKNRAVIESFVKAHGPDLVMDSEDLEIKSTDSVEAELRRRFDMKQASAKIAEAKAEAAEAKAKEEDARLEKAKAESPSPKAVDELPDPSTEKAKPTEPLGEGEHQAMERSILSAFAPLKTVRESLKHEKNIEKFDAFRAKVLTAWKELQA